MNDEPNTTVSVLTSYAFPKLSQYYSSKGKTCIIDQYQNQITQYFINNQLKIQKFYTSSIKKNDFMTGIIKLIDDQNGTQNTDNYSLQTAIKRLYTILQLHKHAISLQPASQINTIPSIIPRVTHSEIQIKKRERHRMDMVHQLSAAQSELSSLQQTVNSLKYITDETQKKLKETEKKEEKYKQTVNELQEELNTEKTQVNEIVTVNTQLKTELSNKMSELEKNKEMAQELNNTNKQLQNELNQNKQQMLSVNEQLNKQKEYQKMINDLQKELQTKQAQIKQIDEIVLWREQLKISSKLDCLDDENIWWTATLIDIDYNAYRIKISYDGFDGKSDEWINRGSNRIAPYMTNATATNNGQQDLGINNTILKPVAKAKYKNGKITKIYKQGFLVKQGKRFKNYKTRYFRLFEDGKMEYFKTMTSKSPLGTFNVKNMIEIRKIEYPNNKHLHGFEIVTADRTWRFRADSDQIVNDWINIIQGVVALLVKEITYNGFDKTGKQELSIQEQKSSHPPITHTGFSLNLIKSMESVSTSGETDDMKELILRPESNIVHSGWMYKQGKWDTNWTYRYCVLSKEPVSLKCYVGVNKRQTHCIVFKNVKSCIELSKNSDKFSKLEIPTMFAFHLVTVSRIYTFACKSKLDINIWLKKIRCLNVVEVVSMDNTKKNMNADKLSRRSSIVKFGSSLNKLSTSFGRLIGVTSEHVTATEVFGKKRNNNNNNPSFERRASVPALSNWTKMQDLQLSRDMNGRRKSAPTLPGLDSDMLAQLRNEMENDVKQDMIEDNENENVNVNGKMKQIEIMDNIVEDDFVNESEISGLDEYDD
eukprot:40115_1